MANFLFFAAIVCGSFLFIEAGLLDGFKDSKDDPYTFSLKEKFDAYDNRGNNVEDIQLRFYNGKSIDQFVDIKLPNAAQLMEQSKFNKENPTVFYSHGYKETADSESVQTVMSAYLQAQPNTNVVLIDWSNMAFGTYHINAAPNTKLVAVAVAAQMKKLVERGLNQAGIHLIGHSLGGQVAGFIGKDIQALGIKINRITALDPAFPLFYPGWVLGHISASDAEFVDIIHTDGGAYGAPVHTGTVDFWPNGGTGTQPGCPFIAPIPLSPEDLCSHWRSWRFYAESVINPKAFPAVQAKSHVHFKDGSYKAGSKVYMGINADKSSSGDYFLTTNGASPFGKGDDGIRHKK